MQTRRWITATQDFLSDQRAAEVTELGVVLGLIVAGSMVVISAIGTKIVSAWNTIDTAIP